METEFNPVYDNMTQVEDYILNFLDKGKFNSLFCVVKEQGSTKCVYFEVKYTFCFRIFVVARNRKLRMRT